MSIFYLLVLKLVPLYAIIALGFLAGRYLDVRKESVASLLLYVIAPLIVFNGVYTTPITAQTLSLPILFFGLCCAFCLIFLKVASRFWEDSTKNILGFTAGTGNTGYFGLPVALALFGEASTGIVVLSTLGFILYENTLGFFVTAKGRHTGAESLRKLLGLPAVYALLLALVLNLSHLHLGGGYADFVVNFRGAYTVLGMMLIGLALGNSKGYVFDGRFIFVSFVARFVAWPVVVGVLIAMDTRYIHFYGPQIHQVMLLMSIVPLAANTVAYATALKAEPEKASMAVLLSTLVAVVYIPLVLILSGLV